MIIRILDWLIDALTALKRKIIYRNYRGPRVEYSIVYPSRVACQGDVETEEANYGRPVLRITIRRETINLRGTSNSLPPL